ncbi:MAG: AAA family ATPase, partial [Haliea sp.]
MNLVSLTLENWRGVSASQIEFDSGVTLIEGPNEVGKSSLVEALRMLFREKSGSKKKDVQAVQPVGEDVGSSVAAEVRCCDYHFTYSKTYNRKHGTELRILAPRAEQLTGDDAHNRAWDILSGHMDMALWDALLVEQGKEIGGVKLADSDGLARALDNAAGGAGASGEESALFDAVQAEYERYFTLKTGKPRYGDEQQRVEKNHEKVQQLQTTLRELEDDLRRFEGVSAEISRLQRAVPELQAAKDQHEQRGAASDGLQSRLIAKEEEGKPLQELLVHARNQWQQRQQAVADIARRAQELEQKQAALQPLAEQVAELEHTVQAAEATQKDLHTQRR